MNAVAAKARIALKNILFATDFSPAAEAALPYAIGLANQYGAKVHGLHVRFPATYPIVGPEAMPQVIEAAEEQAKFEAKQLHEMLATVPHEVTVAEGDLWPMLSEIVEKQKTDLIVMGTHGRKGVSRALLGSAAEEIFRKASCPVLTVGPHVSQEHGAPPGDEGDSLRDGFFTRVPCRAAVRGVHGAGASVESDVAAMLPAKPKVGELVHAEQYAESTLRRLQALVPAEAELWCEPKCRVEQGPEAEKIMEVAIALGADLIVLGVRGPQGGVGATTHLLRSIAHEVVANAQCPVLTVRG